MAETSTSSPPPTSKPLFVRVKRKSFQEKLDAFWLEIKERPLKRPLLDFGNLSLSDSSKKELKTKKVLVQHVETISRSNDMGSVLQSFLPNSSSVNESKTMFEERRHLYKQENKHDLLLSTAKKKHEDLGRNARFEQIWKSRKGNKDDNVDPLHDMCQIYDVIRVDVEDEIPKVKEKEDTSTDYTALLCNYLPMLREFIPEAAKEIESDLLVEESKKDDYVYDVYTVENDTTEPGEDSHSDFPLVQVDEDDYCDDDQQSDYETDDSNAENNPLFDYPEEESSKSEVESQGSSDPEEGSDSEGENEMLNEDDRDYNVGKLMEGHGLQYEEDLPGDYDDEDDWKWEHR